LRPLWSALPFGDGTDSILTVSIPCGACSFLSSHLLLFAPHSSNERRAIPIVLQDRGGLLQGRSSRSGCRGGRAEAGFADGQGVLMEAAGAVQVTLLVQDAGLSRWPAVLLVTLDEGDRGRCHRLTDRGSLELATTTTREATPGCDPAEAELFLPAGCPPCGGPLFHLLPGNRPGTCDVEMLLMVSFEAISAYVARIGALPVCGCASVGRCWSTPSSPWGPCSCSGWPCPASRCVGCGMPGMPGR
jgi:hypothetical protein